MRLPAEVTLSGTNNITTKRKARDLQLEDILFLLIFFEYNFCMHPSFREGIIDMLLECR